MPLRRRLFLKSGFAAVAAGFAMPRIGAVEPFHRPGKSRLLLSLAAYSFRQYFKDSSHKRDKEIDESKRIDLFQFVDYCAAHECIGAELTSYYFPKEVTTDYLLRLKRHCFMRGVAISGGSVGNTFTNPAGREHDQEIAHVKKWIEYSAILGIPHIRVFAGAAPKGVSKEDAKKACIDSLNECCAYAGEHGIFLGIENHGGIVAESDDLIDIIQTVQSPWLGINLDSANFHTEDPYADFARCAPFAVNVQIKSEIRRKGGEKETADLARFIKILGEANYQGYVALEYEAAEDPYLAVPELLAKLDRLMKA